MWPLRLPAKMVVGREQPTDRIAEDPAEHLKYPSPYRVLLIEFRNLQNTSEK